MSKAARASIQEQVEMARELFGLASKRAEMLIVARHFPEEYQDEIETKAATVLATLEWLAANAEDFKAAMRQIAANRRKD